MNILFVNNYYNLFAKADCGASQRSMCMIRALAKIGHVDVVSFVDETISNVPNVDVLFSKEMDRAERKKIGWGKFDTLLKFFAWRNPYFIYPENKEKAEIIDSYLSLKKYDYVATRYIYFACDCGLLKYKDRLLLDYDDDMRDVIRMETKKSKSILKMISGYLYSNTIYLLSCYTSKRVHHAFYSTPHRPLPHADFLPNISAYTVQIREVDFRSTKPVLLLVGNFRYYPNEYGLLRFVQNIFPMIREQIANAEVHVVGNIPDYIMEQIRPYIIDGVELCGFVPQLTDAYSKSRCVVVPIWHGTGTSVKLVEAMALNRAVVTTTMGVRGLHKAFKPGEDYLLADEDGKIAENVVRLLTDEEQNKRLSKSAMGKIQQYYSTERFEAIIREHVRVKSENYE